MLLVSNMYPSPEQPVYGIFVKRFEEQMAGLGVHFSKSVICGRKHSTLAKLAAYTLFFFKTCYLYLAGSGVVYVHYANHSLVPIAIVRWLKRRPLVINAHGDDLLPRTGLTRWLATLLKSTFASADAVVVPSEYFKSLASAKISQHRIIVSPSGGIDTQLFKPLSSRSKVRHQPVKFVYVSRVDQGKGWPTLLNALSSLSNRTWLTVDFYGHGEQVKQLESDIDALGLSEIASYRGALPQHQLVEVFQSADCLIFPSLSESLGLVGLEAMACACPVIASDIPGLMSYVKPHLNGLSFEPNNADDLARCLHEFATLSDSDVMTLRNNARTTAVKYDGALVAERLAKDLNEVLADGFTYVERH